MLTEGLHTILKLPQISFWNFSVGLYFQLTAANGNRCLTEKPQWPKWLLRSHCVCDIFKFCESGNRYICSASALPCDGGNCKWHITWLRRGEWGHATWWPASHQVNNICLWCVIGLLTRNKTSPDKLNLEKMHKTTEAQAAEDDDYQSFNFFLNVVKIPSSLIQRPSDNSLCSGSSPVSTCQPCVGNDFALDTQKKSVLLCHQ